MKTTIQVDKDIATKSVHFLSILPNNLESVAFWGKYRSSLCSLNPLVLYGDNPSISHLLDEILGAFDCVSLPHNLQINGLRCTRKRTSNSDCTECKRICGRFPLERIGDLDICLPTATSKEIIESHKGGRKYLRSETRFMQLLGKGRVKNLLQIDDDFCIIIYDSDVHDELKSMTDSSNVDVPKLNPQDVVQAIKRRYPNNVTVYLSEESFNYLKSIGLPISNELLDPNVVRVENLELMLKHIMEETDSLLKSMHQMRCLLSKLDLLNFRWCLAQRMVEAGVLSKLVQFLSRKDDHRLQLAALEVLIMVSNVAWGRGEHIEEIIKLGAIQPLIDLLGSSHSKVSLRAASALGYISEESFYFRDLALQAGAMQPLLKLLKNHQTSDLESVRTYIRVLNNLCRVKIVKKLFRGSKVTKTPDFELVCPSLQILNELIQHRDEGVVWDACNALGNLSRCSDSQTCLAIRKSATSIQAMIDIGIIPKLILLLNNNEQRGVTKAAVWAVAILLDKSSIEQIKYVVNHGCILPLLDLLEEEDVDIVREALWALLQILNPLKGLWSKSNDLWREGVVVSIVKARGYGKIKHLQTHGNGKSVIFTYSLCIPYSYISSLSTDHFEQTKFENIAPGLGMIWTSIVMARSCW